MARRRRILIGWEEVESAQARMWRQCALGFVSEDDLAGRKKRLGVYWCAADKPSGVDVVGVYRSHVIPEDACCEDCGIGLRHLREVLVA